MRDEVARLRRPRRDSRPGSLSARGRARPVPAASRIRSDLRDAICSLRLQPGLAILEKDLAASYGVSRTPVREALAKLVEDGLVTVYPQAGTFVSRIPFRDLPEALVIRRSLEETSARLAAVQGRHEGVASALAAGRAAAAGDDPEAFHAADEAFHAAVAEAAGYPGLWLVVQQVKVQVDRFRRLTLPQTGRFARVLGEHEAVLRAVAARDADAAAAAMGSHIGNLLADLDAIARAHPDCFDMTPRPPRSVETAVSDADRDPGAIPRPCARPNVGAKRDTIETEETLP